MRGDPTDHLAEELERRGVAAPARLLLDAHRPLRPLLAQAGIFLGPLAGPLLGRRFAELQGTLEDDAAYDRLVARLGETREDADSEGGDA